MRYTDVDAFSVICSDGLSRFGGAGLEEEGCSLGWKAGLMTAGEVEVFAFKRGTSFKKKKSVFEDWGEGGDRGRGKDTFEGYFLSFCKFVRHCER